MSEETLREDYETYYNECERANRIPLPYDQWRAKQLKEK